MKRSSNTRNRNFACVVYLDSAPKDWLQQLQSEFVPAFVSPLHDKDINPDGSLKKPHHHVLVMFDGVKTEKQWDEFRSKFGGVGTEIILSKRGYSRYLCHLDNPEKQRYNPQDVIELGGADYASAISRDSDKYKIIDQMIEFISRNHITSYVQLMDYSRQFEPEWYHGLCDSCSYVISTYLKEYRREFYDK